MQFTVGETPVTVTKWTVVALLLATACAGYGGYDYVQQSAAVEDAVAVDATIHEAAVESDSGGRRSGIQYGFDVEFTYRYEGTEYTSDRVFPGSISRQYDSRSDAEAVLEPYEPNATVTAYVDPSAPGEAFLERQTTSGPFVFVGGGAVVFALVALNAIGARDPGQHTDLRPERESTDADAGTLLGVDRNAVNTASKRLMVAGPVLVLVSVLALVGILLAAGGGAPGASPTLESEPTDPAGLAVFGLAGGLGLLVLGVVLYLTWSFGEYRRVRARVREPRPPSPFRHPSRLVTILGTDDDDLDAYGWRVKRTGFALAVLAVLGAVVAELLVF
ncbi:DUF3592 domain-containing protein [Halobacterium jilantaiense]|uniref:DUF3592 domain-containing protein n=1 Tax=Halobacterium jilantaiense TaxID=355548 RepID=A0A1I0Q4B5_9EURY|nr:DUF3592 domain-containing protein [Halobacterium jilantaiense]SEW21813.1 Protein of unknown function [Halobacterium jilantaiense]